MEEEDVKMENNECDNTNGTMEVDAHHNDTIENETIKSEVLNTSKENESFQSADGTLPDNYIPVPPTKIRRNHSKSKKKKKMPKDVDAPKHPHTGYVRYMNERREELKRIRPGSTAIELTKIIGEEWNNMAEDKKKPYLDAADIDKERFAKEMAEYKARKSLSSPQKEESEKPLKMSNGVKHPTIHKEINRNGPTKDGNFENQNLMNGNNIRDIPKLPKNGEFDIPIFTDEFLYYNKIVDSELRALRKSNTDFEQQNAILEKHIENMENGIDKLETETGIIKQNNSLLGGYLTSLRGKLFTVLSQIDPNGVTMENLDRYLQELSSPNFSNTAILNKAKDAIRKLQLPT